MNRQYELVAKALSSYVDETDDYWFEMLENFCNRLSEDSTFNRVEFEAAIQKEYKANRGW